MPRGIRTAFHMLDAGNFPSIREYGLMSASRLIGATEGSSRHASRSHRPESQRLASGILIRNQKPMPQKALARCLQDGLAPEDWFELLNSKVFFWVDAGRLNRQRRACGTSTQIVLTVDAARLLARYGAQATVTPINTGNAMRAAAPRNRTTFVPYQRWIKEGWAHEKLGRAATRASSHKPVELTIDDAVPDIMDYVTAVVTLRAGEPFRPGSR